MAADCRLSEGGETVDADVGGDCVRLSVVPSVLALASTSRGEPKCKSSATEDSPQLFEN